MHCNTHHCKIQCTAALHYNSVNSSENGVFCARGVNGMHAMGLQLHFCQARQGSTTQCNAMPFSDTLQLAMHYTAVVQVITWAGAVGSPKLPRPVGEQTFLHSFQNSQQLQHLLAPSSIIIALHWITICPTFNLFRVKNSNVSTHRELRGGLAPTFCPRFFSAVFASNLFIVRPRSVLGARSA